MERFQFEREIWIGNKKISDTSPTFIIAEAGVNHNGDLKKAKKLIDEAVEAGVDAIKFQAFKTDKLILKDIAKAPYQRKTTERDESQYEMLKKLELNHQQNQILKDYCKEKDIIYLSTPFEEDSLEELCQMDIEAIKVAATDATNIQFLIQIAKKGKPMILSAGMCYSEEIEKVLREICPLNKKVILLQCTANYPIKDEEANLSVIRTFQEKFDILVGYSDHSQGVGASPYAVALGAKLVEKHFTLDKNLNGPDHRASVDPQELRELVQRIRKVEKYMGVDIKMPTISEQGTRKSLQKCFVAKEAIKKGDIYTENNIVAKRTNGVGLSAIYYYELLGKSADRDYKENDII